MDLNQITRSRAVAAAQSALSDPEGLTAEVCVLSDGAEDACERLDLGATPETARQAFYDAGRRSAGLEVAVAVVSLVGHADSLLGSGPHVCTCTMSPDGRTSYALAPVLGRYAPRVVAYGAGGPGAPGAFLLDAFFLGRSQALNGRFN